jgi:hypothetical protein
MSWEPSINSCNQHRRSFYHGSSIPTLDLLSCEDLGLIPSATKKQNAYIYPFLWWVSVVSVQSVMNLSSSCLRVSWGIWKTACHCGPGSDSGLDLGPGTGAGTTSDNPAFWKDPQLTLGTRQKAGHWKNTVAASCGVTYNSGWTEAWEVS